MLDGKEGAPSRVNFTPFPPERACPPRESLLPVHVVRGCAQPAGPEKAVLPDARLAPR